MEEKMYTKEDIKKIINSIDYADILDDNDFFDLVEKAMMVYQKGRKGNSPDILLRAGLHNAIEEGIKYYYRFGGE